MSILAMEELLVDCDPAVIPEEVDGGLDADHLILLGQLNDVPEVDGGPDLELVLSLQLWRRDVLQVSSVGAELPSSQDTIISNCFLGFQDDSGEDDPIDADE